MSPQDTIRPLNTYLLVDATKSWRMFPAPFETLVNQFKQHYEQGSLIKHQLITLPKYEASGEEQPWTENCDLGYGFKQVLERLPATPDPQIEVFILLQNKPGGDWMAPLSELKAQGDAGIHVFQLAGNDQNLTAEDVSLLYRYQVDLRVFPDQGRLKDYAAAVLEARTGRAGWIPQTKAESQPGTGQAEEQAPVTTGAQAGEVGHPASAIVPAGLAGQTQGTIQAVPAAGEEPPSLRIRVPLQKPAGAEAAASVAQSHETIPLEQPLSEPTAEAPRVEEAPASAQVAVTTAEKSETANEVAAQEAQQEPKPAQPVPVEEARPKQPETGGGSASKKVEVEAATRQPAEPEKAVPPPTPRPEPEPPVGKDGVASNWKNIDPPADMEDQVAHTATLRLPAGENWILSAASRRGKMHAHQGIFREDAFALGYAEGWNFVIVADGGGSRPLARVGSRLAAEAGVEAMVAEARNQAKSSSPPESVCRYILMNAIQQAYDAIRKEAQNRERKIDDFGTTFLAIAHRPSADQHLLGALQVGDGLIAAMLPERPPIILADPDVGEAASQTLFLTSRPWNEWLNRIKVYNLEFEPAMLVCMCDGVSDDLIPYKTNLPPLFAVLSDKVREEKPEEALLDFLGYDKRGSFDDRTLAVIYPKQAGGLPAAPAAETAEPVKADKSPAKAKVKDARPSGEG